VRSRRARADLLAVDSGLACAEFSRYTRWRIDAAAAIRTSASVSGRRLKSAIESAVVLWGRSRPGLSDRFGHGFFLSVDVATRRTRVTLGRLRRSVNRALLESDSLEASPIIDRVKRRELGPTFAESWHSIISSPASGVASANGADLCSGAYAILRWPVAAGESDRYSFTHRRCHTSASAASVPPQPCGQPTIGTTQTSIHDLRGCCAAFTAASAGSKTAQHHHTTAQPAHPASLHQPGNRRRLRRQSSASRRH
jgi:hypothetical protein